MGWVRWWSEEWRREAEGGRRGGREVGRGARRIVRERCGGLWESDGGRGGGWCGRGVRVVDLDAGEEGGESGAVWCVILAGRGGWAGVVKRRWKV